MARPSRLVLGALLVIAAACGTSTPTAPKSANTMGPDHGALMVEGDTTCRSGFGVTNGKC